MVLGSMKQHLTRMKMLQGMSALLVQWVPRIGGARQEQQHCSLLLIGHDLRASAGSRAETVSYKLVPKILKKLDHINSFYPKMKTQFRWTMDPFEEVEQEEDDRRQKKLMMGKSCNNISSLAWLTCCKMQSQHTTTVTFHCWFSLKSHKRSTKQSI
jgi:hypothetical protein